jgi:hypothetical protein
MMPLLVIDMHLLFNSRTHKIFVALAQIQRVSDLHFFNRQEEIYSVDVKSIENDSEMAIHISIHAKPCRHFSPRIVISQDQLGMLDEDFDNALVWEEWDGNTSQEKKTIRHPSNDKNFAFLLYACQQWVMVEKRSRKKFDQDRQMKSIRKKLEAYFKTWI